MSGFGSSGFGGFGQQPTSLGFGGGGGGDSGFSSGFGGQQQQQQQQNTSLFGQPVQQQQQVGFPPQQQQQPQQPQQTQPATGFGSTFGQPVAASHPAPPTATGGFGNVANNTGFGSGAGGFGQSTNNNANNTTPAFGANNNTSAPTAFGGGFGNNTSGGGGFSGGGFGQSMQQQQQQPSAFGSSTNVGFGSSSSSSSQQAQQQQSTLPTPFGQPQQHQSSGLAGFGGGAINASSSFSSSQAPIVFGTSSTVVTNANNTTTAPSTQMAGFAPATSTTPGGFGNNSGASSTGFGGGFGSSSHNNTSTGFGAGAFGSSSNNNVSTGFDGSSQNTINNTSTGFGGSSQNNSNNTSIGFGSTHKVWQRTPTSGSGGGAGGPSSNDYNAMSSTPAPSSGFGSSFSSPFDGGAQSSSTIATGTGFGATSSTSTTLGKPGSGGFGDGTPNTTGFGSTDSTTSSTPFGKRIPRKTQGHGGLSVNATPFQPSEGKDSASTTMDDDDVNAEKLAALRAKLQAKKKKLKEAEAKKAKQQQPNEGADVAPPSNRNAELAAKNAVRFGGGGISKSKSSNDKVPPATNNAELAAKNALRFSTSNSDRDQTLNNLLPTDLKERSNNSNNEDNEWSTPAQSGDETENDDDDEDDDGRNLSNAKSLVGICMSMCPDEELLRREREGDIQLLEVTDPGGLHPKDWTLRDTAVKRFRRSAADFKLDIPELVRPPEVLERVCGYLEEWVMERDRQGVDKRWAQQPSDIPPPLDVYQFVWDRTRMIRKDFILQNYIGTGGKCDARAVRCHERIARWHAMCEHQLSHVPEFVTHQSQQNIAELGQTMKSLNNYYDDSLGRSLIEVDTSNIQSERLAANASEGSSTSAHPQGCASDIIMGKSPTDFDGSILANDANSADISSRIIGRNGVKSASLGTAEPEMRGLYILLTLNNEGGMEVLKYSGRLCVNKPAIFYSKPVQLALSIFQAKKDHNYARFFSLLRSPSTPYLFSCIMFKYVENMRKDALTIMSKTYGAKHKTTGEAFYDSYPLANLTKLLCYEDEEEARAACQHYGLVVEGDQVMWRHGKFREPRDPVKGFIIPLKPRKMTRTIESKLNGATRLSVCRGGVSGEGATLSNASCDNNNAPTIEVDRKKALEAAEKARKEAMKQQLEADAKARAQAEIMEKERQRVQKIEAEKRARAEAAKRAELERLEKERIRREQVLAEQRRKEEEFRRLAEAKAAAERAEQERLEKEARELEAARIKAEEEKKERERQRLLAKQREEEARRLAEAKAAAERAEREKREKEAREREAARKKAEEEERIRKAREAEARRIEMMWREKIEKARKILAWRVWRKQMHKQDTLRKSRRSLGSLDPTSTHYPIPLQVQDVAPTSNNAIVTGKITIDDGLENQIYRLATASRRPLDLSSMVAECMFNSSAPDVVYPSNIQSNTRVILFKLLVVLPKRVDGVYDFYDTLRMWVNSHIKLGHISSHSFQRRSQQIEVRAVAVIANEDYSKCNDCNAALFLLPSSPVSSPVEFPEEVEDLLSHNVSRMVLVLDDEKCSHNNPLVEDILDHLVGSNQPRQGVATPKLCHLDDAFLKCCITIVKSSIMLDELQLNLRFDPSLVRVSAANVGFLCLQRLLLQNCGNTKNPPVFSLCKQALELLIEELDQATADTHKMLQNWPPIQFMRKETDAIPMFFDDGQYDLPIEWYIAPSDLNEQMSEISQDFLEKDSFIQFVAKASEKLSLSQRQMLFTLIDNDEIERCVANVVSLIVNGELSMALNNETMLYIPADTLSDIISKVAACKLPPTPEPVLDMQIPDYLYQRKTEGKENNNSIENFIEAPAREEVVVVANKRKPAEIINEQESPGNVRGKRSRCNETEEERRSKDFTSFLEALL